MGGPFGKLGSDPVQWTFGTPTDVAKPAEPRDVLAIDIDRDDILDLVIPQTGVNAIAILSGLGKGTYQARPDLSLPGRAGSITAADFNGDGNLDLAISVGMIGTDNSLVIRALAIGGPATLPPGRARCSVVRGWESSASAPPRPIVIAPSTGITSPRRSGSSSDHASTRCGTRRSADDRPRSHGRGACPTGSSGSKKPQRNTASEEEAWRQVGGPATVDEMPGSSSMLGHDLSAVSAHSGAGSNAMGAAAYATGSDIHFGAGQSGAGAASGKQLLGHELAHVVQQGSARPADIQAAVGHYGE